MISCYAWLFMLLLLRGVCVCVCVWGGVFLRTSCVRDCLFLIVKTDLVSCRVHNSTQFGLRYLDKILPRSFFLQNTNTTRKTTQVWLSIFFNGQVAIIDYFLDTLYKRFGFILKSLVSLKIKRFLRMCTLSFISAIFPQTLSCYFVKDITSIHVISLVQT